MASILAATCTDTQNIESIQFSDSHVAPTSTAVVTALSTTLSIGDSAEVSLGYQGDTFGVITGFVKAIEHKEAERKYTITIANVMVRAIDFFIAASDPEEPFSRQNITAEDLIQDVLELSGLNDFDMESTSFTFAINNPVEVNLTSAYDYAHFLANIIAYTLYADNDGTVHLINRRPYPEVGEAADYTFNDPTEMITVSYNKSDRDLRNKVIVYGSAGIHAEASEASPYLPVDFYKTVVVAAPGVIDSQQMAEQSAEYNLELLNRLTESVELTIIGQTGIIPRTIAEIDVDDLNLDGKWYIYAVEHMWSKAGYLTTLELRR